MAEEKELLEEENKEEVVESEKTEEVVETENTEEVAVVENNEEKEEAPVEEVYTGPTITTATRYDYRTMKYYNMYNMVYKRHFAIIYIVMGLFSIAFAGYSIYTVLASDSTSFTNYILPAIFVLFGAYFIYQAFTMEKIIDKNITRHFAQNPKVVTVNVTVTEEKIALHIVGRDGDPLTIDWAYVSEIVEINEYFFMLAQGQPVIIEKDPNKVIEGSYDDLVNIIMEKAKAKPYKKLEKELVTKPITYVHPEDIVDEAEATEVVEEETKDNKEE